MGEAKRKAKAKKDLGIISYGKGLKVSEETRDQIKSHDWSEGPRNLGRSPDDWSTAECERKQFSGFRVNKIMHRMELWVLGRLAGHIELDKCTPGAMASLHEAVFKTSGTVVEIPGKEEV